MTKYKRMPRKKTTTGTITYPISTNYREKWGEWEIVREVIQNAIDTGTKVTTEFNNGCLKVIDEGNGFELKHLLIGEGEKDGISSIGKFHEGVKFALLTVARNENMDAVIETNNLIIKPRITKMFEKDILAIDYEITDRKKKNTVVTITGIQEDHSDKFLSSNLNYNLQDRVLFEMPGKLFIKGIFVKNIDSIFGYNLNIERENPVSGDIDDEQLNEKICEILEETKNIQYLSGLSEKIKEMNEVDVKDFIEFKVGYYRIWNFKNKQTHLKALYKAFGSKKICRATNIDYSRQAVYKKWVVVLKNIPYLRFLKKDIDVVSLEKEEVDEKIPYGVLNTQERSNLNWARKIVEGATREKIKKLSIVNFKDQPHITGEAKLNSFIKISKNIVENRQELLETLIHEMVHYLTGYGDLTHEFQEAHGKLSTKIIIFILDNKGKKLKMSTINPEEKKKRKKLQQEKIRSDFLESYLSFEKNGENPKEKTVEALLEQRKNIPAIAGAFGIYTVGMNQEKRIEAILNAIINETKKN